jgi:hypothetical protein
LPQQTSLAKIDLFKIKFNLVVLFVVVVVDFIVVIQLLLKSEICAAAFSSIDRLAAKTRTFEI